LREGGSLKYHVEVDRDRCIACGNCYSTDPAHFESGDQGKSKIVSGTTNGKSTGSFDDNRISDAKAAAEECPVQAITVTET
jgi:ferredoxin